MLQKKRSIKMNNKDLVGKFLIIKDIKFRKQ